MTLNRDALSYSTNAYPTYSGEILLDQVSCDGDESSIDECLHDGWGNDDCSHNEDVNLVCTEDASEVLWIPIVVPIVVVVVLVVLCSLMMAKKSYRSKSTRPSQATGTITNSRTEPAASSSNGPKPGSQPVYRITSAPPRQSQFPSGTPYTDQGTGPHMSNPAPGIGYLQGGQINHGYVASPSSQPYPQMPKTPAGPPPGRLAPVTHTQQTPGYNGMTPVGNTGEIGDLPPPPSYSMLYNTSAQPDLHGPPN